MNISKFSILFIFLSTILSCTSTNSDVPTDPKSKSSLQVVDCQYFQERMQSDEPYLLLDVRTQEEVDQGMITGAEHMDFYAADFTQSLEKLDKEQPILVRSICFCALPLWVHDTDLCYHCTHDHTNLINNLKAYWPICTIFSGHFTK